MTSRCSDFLVLHDGIIRSGINRKNGIRYKPVNSGSHMLQVQKIVACFAPERTKIMSSWGLSGGKANISESGRYRVFITTYCKKRPF